MDTSLATLINIHTLSTGRRLFALARVMKAANERYLRSRRAVQDVNPETGEVDPNAPVAEASPAAKVPV